MAIKNSILISLTCTILLLADRSYSGVNHYELVQMSAAVYSDNGGKAPAGWEIIQIASHSGGYAVAIFMKIDGSEYVIAHRGTDTLTDISSNYSIYKEDIPPQFYRAEEFVKAATEKHNIDINAITHTGHSLGGYIAELCAADATTAGTKAVTFDSPGTKNVIRKYPRFDQAPDVHTYMGSPNAINTANEQSGRIIERVYAKLSVPKWTSTPSRKELVAEYGRYTIQRHSISGIMETFDPKTGKPFFSTKYNVAGSQTWPVGILGSPSDLGGFGSYLKYSENTVYWDMATRGLPDTEAKKFISDVLGGLDGKSFRPAEHYIGGITGTKKEGRGMSTWYFKGKPYYEQGEYKNGVAEGRGLVYWIDSPISRVVGNFKQGDMIGGRVDFPNGDYAVGSFKQGKMHGPGTYYFRGTNLSTKSVSGNYTNHRLSRGIIESRDGAKYTGDLKFNVAKNTHETIGEGKIEFPKGTSSVKVIEGTFGSDNASDVNIEYYNGDQYKGKMIGQVMEGSGKYTFANGNSVEGQWHKGKRNGLMTHRFANGYYQKSQFSNGVLSGVITRYKPGGEIIAPQNFQSNPNFIWWRRNPTISWYYGEGGLIQAGPNFMIDIQFD